MLVAAAQLLVSPHAEENLAKGCEAIVQAAGRGASLIVFPELFMAWEPNTRDPAAIRALAQPLDGPFVRSLAHAARDAGVWVVSGMVEEPGGSEYRAHNTTVVLNDRGELVAAYRKTHLFDAFGYEESRTIAPGDSLFKPIETPFGCMGLLVCYELRFPEVAHRQAERGADLLVVPSAWVAGPMKELHWRTLVLARAIENILYVIAAGQVGNQFLGRSLIVDPMGVVLAEGSEEEDLIYGELDLSRVGAVREKVPSLQHRRADLY